MSKYILLTGGTGFVGSHLLEELLNLNKRVILLKRSFSNSWRINELIDNRNLVLKNTDEDKLNDIFNNYDIEGIFHLATFAQRSHESEYVQEMIDSNISFPTQLLENSINNNVKFFINTGSFSEYELKNSPISEKSKIKSFNLYASTKTAFEEILKFYSDNYDLMTSTLKLFTPYGPKDDEIKIMPYLIINSIKKNNLLIKSPTKKLDFIYVKDVIECYIALMNNISKLQQYESFNVGTGIGTSLKDVLKIIEGYLGKNEIVEYGNLEDEKVWCSNRKIKEKLDYIPKINLEKGIKYTIDYYNKIYNK